MSDLQRYFDKLDSGPGVWKWEHYMPVYERYFEKFRGREVHLLEVGVYSGGSLRMWQWYLGKEAHIYGVDIRPECRVYQDERVRIFTGDQADREFWREFVTQVPPLDIVIDDGGHQVRQQVATFEELLPHLAPSGVYLCEDIYGYNPFREYINERSHRLDEYTPDNAALPPARPGQVVPPDHLLTPNRWQRTIDAVHTHPFVTVVEMRAVPLSTLVAPRHGTEWAEFPV